MKKDEKAFKYLSLHPILVPKQKAKDLLSETKELSADQLVTLANKAKRRDFAEFKVKQPVLVECLDEPRMIKTRYGPIPVVDVEDPQTGKEWTILLKHKLLEDKILVFTPLTRKRFYIMNLGKVPGKDYYDYIVMLEEDVLKSLAKTKPGE
ncbi:MAG: hypothetical protein HWN68_02260 [Desulfobacterales bacterium]|nr:hypothetical protein [Desulfobacterales bacterium]